MSRKLTPSENRRAWLYAALIVLALLACAGAAVLLSGGTLAGAERVYLPEEGPLVQKAAAGLDSITVDAVFDPDMIYKTLVLTGDRQSHLVCVIPVEKELDLKAVARASGNKSVSMLPQKELLPLTGYLRGGCSPIGMKKLFPTYLDEAAREQPRLSVSAGVRGCQVILATEALMACTRASFAPLCR